MKEKIAKIQEDIGVMKKDTKGYNYKYFDINQLLEKLKPMLTEQKLLLTQPLTNIDGKPAITTRIEEIDGVGIIESTTMLPDIQDPQKLGSAITYMRRYSLVSLLSLESEDDDGASATKKAVTKKDDNTDSTIPF